MQLRQFFVCQFAILMKAILIATISSKYYKKISSQYQRHISQIKRKIMFQVIKNMNLNQLKALIQSKNKVENFLLMSYFCKLTQ